MKKFIPNFITLLNLSCGIIALRYAMDQAFDMALLWFFLGIVFDFFDGFAARWLKVTSPLGLQLDSLADMVTSGLVPGQVMYSLISYTFLSSFCGVFGNSCFGVSLGALQYRYPSA